jgi:hypothetical protein
MRLANAKGHQASGFTEACFLCHNMSPPVKATATRRAPALIHINEAGDFDDLSSFGNWVN